MDTNLKWYESINFKLAAIITILILFALQFIGANFITQLEEMLVESHKEDSSIQVDFIETTAEPYLLMLENGNNENNGNTINPQQEINTLLSEFDGSGTIKAEVMLPDLTIVGTSDNTEQGSIGQLSDDPDIQQALLVEDTVSRQYRDPASQDRRWKLVSPVYSNSDPNNILGLVSLTTNIERVYVQVDNITQIFLQASLISIILTLILANSISRAISKPIIEMQAETKNIASGDYTGELKVQGHDEIGILAFLINELSMKVSTAQESIDAERRRLDGVLKYMSDGVLATNSSGEITLSNQKAREILGAKEGEIEGKMLTEVLGIQYDFEDLFETDFMILLDVDDQILQANFSTVKDEAMRVKGLVSVLHDVTEQERLEQDRKEFVSNVSHELRTPLTSMRSYLEALNDGAWKEPEIAPKFLEVTQKETDRMIRMIQDLLQLSRIDAESDRLNMEIMDLTALLTFVLDRFDMYIASEETSGKEYTIERDLPKESIWIMGDEDRMTQVLDNIMNNAIKYSIEGGNIRVSMKREGNEVRISVADEGIGISQKDLQRIFSRFYRVDKARSREMGGSGLGLAISKEVIEQHHGHIWARSKENEGTTFIITLPCEDMDSFGEDEWSDE